MTGDTKSADYQQNLREKIFRIKGTIRTIELKQVMTPGERDCAVDTMTCYAAVLDALLSDAAKNDVIELPPDVAARGGAAIDEHLKKEKDKSQ